MTDDRKLKLEIRARMRWTGESYAVARRRVLEGWAEIPISEAPALRAYVDCPDPQCLDCKNI